MNFINCRLLHWSYEKHAVPEVPEHTHSYYQIELCVNGTIKFKSSRNKRILHSSEWMLIPPGTPHSMIYEGRELEYYSFKFEVNNYNIALENELIFQKGNPLSHWVIDSLSKQRPPDKYLYMPINENRAVLEALLLSMFQQALSPIAGKPAMPKILRDISDMMRKSLSSYFLYPRGQRFAFSQLPAPLYQHSLNKHRRHIPRGFFLLPKQRMRKAKKRWRVKE